MLDIGEESFQISTVATLLLVLLNSSNAFYVVSDQYAVILSKLGPEALYQRVSKKCNSFICVVVNEELEISSA